MPSAVLCRVHFIEGVSDHQTSQDKNFTKTASRDILPLETFDYFRKTNFLFEPNIVVKANPNFSVSKTDKLA